MNQSMLQDALRAGKRIRQQRPEPDRSALLKHHIELNPQRPAAYEARTSEDGIPIWVLVSSVDVAGGDIQSVADAYEIPCEAVEAALLYFLRYLDEITARIQGNRLPGAIHAG